MNLNENVIQLVFLKFAITNLIFRFYKFILVFESDICQDYVSGSIWNILESNLLPVVFGRCNLLFLCFIYCHQRRAEGFFGRCKCTSIGVTPHLNSRGCEKIECFLWQFTSQKMLLGLLRILVMWFWFWGVKLFGCASRIPLQNPVHATDCHTVTSYVLFSN